MQRIVITGGTGSLGRIVVPRLARDYDCVVLSHRDADLRDARSVVAAFERIGEIYALVHLAGGFAAGSVAETSEETWQQMLELNLTGAFHAMRAALPHLTRPGRIVAISAFVSLQKPKGVAAYTVSKSALNALVEVIAKENPGIAANVIAPGTLDDALRNTIAETIAFLLSDAAAHVSGSLLALPVPAPAPVPVPVPAPVPEPER